MFEELLITLWNKDLMNNLEWPILHTLRLTLTPHLNVKKFYGFFYVMLVCLFVQPQKSVVFYLAQV